jgi:tetratricopeptide (TPR) repeat protein
MKRCHSCGLSIGDTATFCATCGAAVPAAAACPLCGAGAASDEPFGLCMACAAALALLASSDGAGSPALSLAAGPLAQQARATVATAVYSAVVDDATCPECAAWDGRETGDVDEARAWAPNPRCSAPGGCRCLVLFEHERLVEGESPAFVAFAAARSLAPTGAAVAAFHDEQRRRTVETESRIADALTLAGEARVREKTDPSDAAALYRRAIEILFEARDVALEERRVLHELPAAFNRLTIVLKDMGRDAEALDEVERAASLGLLDRADCGRKADRDALRNRGARLRERLGAPVVGAA